MTTEQRIDRLQKQTDKVKGKLKALQNATEARQKKEAELAALRASLEPHEKEVQKAKVAEAKAQAEYEHEGQRLVDLVSGAEVLA